MWVKAKKYISKVIADVFEIQCWIIISLNLAQPYSNFTKRLPVVNRFEVMLDQGFRSMFRRSPWIILVGRIFSLPLTQHCSEFTKRLLVGDDLQFPLINVTVRAELCKILVKTQFSSLWSISLDKGCAVILNKISDSEVMVKAKFPKLFFLNYNVLFKDR